MSARTNEDKTAEAFSAALPALLMRADRSALVSGTRIFGIEVWPLLRFHYYARTKGSQDLPVRAFDRADDARYFAFLRQDWLQGRKLTDQRNFEDLSWPEVRLRRALEWCRDQWMPTEAANVAEKDLSPDIRTLRQRIRKFRDKGPEREQEYAAALEGQVAKLKDIVGVDFLFVTRPAEHYQDLAGKAYAPIADSFIDVLEAYGRCGKIALTDDDRAYLHRPVTIDASIAKPFFPSPEVPGVSGRHIIN